MKLIQYPLFCIFTFAFILFSCQNSIVSELEESFAAPPDSARPGVYWYFMDGNISKEGMTKDLESMKQAGIGSVVFLEVNVGVPRGNVDMMSPEWKSCFKHAVSECERLGISMILGIGPGWTGSGGPWVSPDKSMRHLVSSAKQVSGKGMKNIILEIPQPKKPFFGERSLNQELKNKWKEYYEDVAVLAFPSVKGEKRITDIDEKALYYRAPYSSRRNVKQFIPRTSDSIPLKTGEIICKDQIIDLTRFLKNDTLAWDVPEGEWTVMRIGLRNNGAITRPAPFPGLGFECDKSDTTALMAHLDRFTEELFNYIGPRDTSLSGGLKILHMDSWEMGAQNWSPVLRKEFKKRRGYDPLPYYPIYSGYIIGNRDISERFLWDLRQTMQELMLENHSLFVKRYAHQKGLQLSIEPYDMNPMQDLELGATADIPMGEFWSPHNYNTTYSICEAASIANIKGQRTVPAEAFTAWAGWEQYPASMKNQTDWAFAAGINRLTIHTFQHQALADSLKPGMVMGINGIQWNRNQTWWPYVGAYHRYISRCQYLLQKGMTVADILYLAPEEAPFVFKAPESFLYDKLYTDKRDYNFDACPPSLLKTATTEEGNVKFPSGAAYRLLVLPHFKTMTLEMLEKIADLVNKGATVLGLPPQQTPGLAGYPDKDCKLKELSRSLWGGKDIPEGLVSHRYGKGTVIWGDELLKHEDNLYTDHRLTCRILHDMEIPCDFKADNDNIRFIHKKIKDTEYYFIADRSGIPQSTTCHFRVSGKQPYLWDAVTGQIRELPEYENTPDGISVKMTFDRHQSFFVFFTGRQKKQSGRKNFYADKKVAEINGPWHVSFDPKWGGPADIEFPDLTDWSKSDIEGIRYYSGTAVYSKKFTFTHKNKDKLYLDLGNVRNIARIWLNGKDLGTVWTFPWRVDITEAVIRGDNELKIEVTNLWPNRLIGDASKLYDGIDFENNKWPEWLLKGEKRPSNRYTFLALTYLHFKPDSRLLESGLLGPVKIIENQ